MDELKPCPLCGGRSLTKYAIGNHRWMAFCTQCDLKLGFLGGNYYIEYYKFNTEEEAIKTWNKRSN